MPSSPERESSGRKRSGREELSRSKGSWRALSSVLTHALRTPLSAILGMSKLLVDGRLEAEERRHAEVIQSSSESLLRLVEELVDFATLEAGLIRLDAGDFFLRDVVEEVIEAYKPPARSKRLDLRLMMAEGVPDPLRGDRERLRQVLEILIGNALRFTRRGFVFVTVTRDDGEAEDPRPWLRFSVRDTGIGIAPEQQDAIFEPFAQMDHPAPPREGPAAPSSFGGTGLGLALSRGLVQAMGGRIGVDSTPGEGSTFTFVVPFEPAWKTAADLTASAAGVAAAAPGGRERRNFRILVAEDDKINQMLAQRVLEEAGYVADTASNGLQALEALERASYDLILMDCQMPELDGYEATRLIRQIEKGQRGTAYRHVPVIAVTAMVTSEDQKKCTDAGMDNFLAKPFRAEDLVQAVDRHLGFPVAPTAPSADGDGSFMRGDAPAKVLDDEVFRQLRELSGPLQEGFLSTLLDTFVRERDERSAKLEEALEAGDTSRLATLSHKLISASGSVGAYRLAKLSGDLEIRARGDDADACRKLLDELLKEYEKAETALLEVLASIR